MNQWIFQDLRIGRYTFTYGDFGNNFVPNSDKDYADLIPLEEI